MKTTNKLLLSLILITLFSCTKDNEFIKQELEKALPEIEITSLGLFNQYGPYSRTDVIQATFGGSITNAEEGSLAFAWYTTDKIPSLVDSVYFSSWNIAPSSATKNSGVSTMFLDTTYPNTSSFTGKLNLPLANLPAGASYTLRLYVRNTHHVTSSIAVSNFVNVE